MESSSSSNTGNSAFSDDDLIASLAGFAVEGQTERDLATIKSMLLSQHSGNHNQQQFTHNSYNSSNGGTSHWPMASPAATTTAWTSFQWNPASGQPPPNTPTLSKSMELYGNQQQQQQAGNEYFGGGFYSNLHSSQGRRRDVSLERPHLLSSSRNACRHGRSASITSSVNADDQNSVASTTPGSSLSNGFDMDMEEEITPTNEAGPSDINPPAFIVQQPHYLQHQPQGMNGNHESNGIWMEDIQEDRMRESMEDASTINHHHASTLSSSSYPISPSSAASPFDNRTALSSSGVAEVANKQWRSNTSTPIPSKPSDNQIQSRPHSSNSFHQPASPIQTRSRSRQQLQQQQAAALRFTSP